MIDKKNRLVKLARRSPNYATFESTAMRATRWYFAPWVQAGNMVTRSWLTAFYNRMVTPC